jgi:hypothetical protein
LDISQSIINKLKKEYETLGILEAIDAFYQIKGLVNEETQKHPCPLQDSLLQLHHCLLASIQASPQKEGLKLGNLKKLINLIEEDVYRINNNTGLILAATYKVKRLFSF